MKSSWPTYSTAEVEVATRILQSGAVNYWNGTEGRAFEQEFADFTQRDHAISVTNGTLALELSLRSLGIGEGDEVIVSPRTFIATASSVVACGAIPRFVDVDKSSGNITPASVEEALTDKTKAVIVVHLGGWPCDMTGFQELASEHDLRLVEDCAQAHGARWCDKPVGSFGDAAAFSFCTDKIISTAGEGGMVVLDDHMSWKKAWAYRDHGKSLDAVHAEGHPPGFRWLVESFGTNWRMPEIQAAIGRIQLRNLSKSLSARRENAALLLSGLSRIEGLRIPVPEVSAEPAWYRFYGYLETEKLRNGWDQNRIVSTLVERGVPCAHGTCPELYLEKAFGTLGDTLPRLPVAKELGETSFMLPVDPSLTPEDMQTCVAIFEEIMAAAQR